MPYRSERQRRYMHAKHPDIAARWDAEYGSTIQPRRKVKGSVRNHRRRRRAR